MSDKWFYKEPYGRIADGAVADHEEAKVLRFYPSHIPSSGEFVDVEFPDGSVHSIDSGWLYREGEKSTVLNEADSQMYHAQEMAKHG